ncbi:MAG: glycosyltransferase family 4 protein [Acidobacteriia bacterium]|nr:glycosyltransferase family 4 protein [Terriglobia bacterium]
MPTVAYLANQFPSPVEPYVFEEIGELRRRGVQVIPCSARRTDAMQEDQLQSLAAETLYLQPLGLLLLMRGAWLCLRRCTALANILSRVLLQGGEPPARRARTLLHTLLGACYALKLQGRGVQHIHVHHGYFGSWVAMVAARLLSIDYSLTLHGSDLLLHGVYLDTKLKCCAFCVTVSEFNRDFLLEHYPGVEPGKIMVRRLGVDLACTPTGAARPDRELPRLTMLAVGRLHPVKDHAFLLHACHELKSLGTDFLCLIAGEGPQRPWLEHLIRNLGLEAQVKLLGHLCRQELDACYRLCDLVVLTSRSEGIPLVLMEAMAHCTTVLAPAITGIPELVKHGETGFLYHAGSLEDFVTQIEIIRNSPTTLPRLRRAARQHVLEHFDREKNLAALAELLVFRITRKERHDAHENPVLQQI